MSHKNGTGVWREPDPRIIERLEPRNITCTVILRNPSGVWKCSVVEHAHSRLEKGFSSMASRSVHRSAKTGRFVSKATVARWPGKTTTERVGTGTSNNRPVYRSAKTGQFVSTRKGKTDPSGTIRQWV